MVSRNKANTIVKVGNLEEDLAFCCSRFSPVFSRINLGRTDVEKRFLFKRQEFF